MAEPVPDVFGEGTEAATRVTMVLAMAANEIIRVRKQRAEAAAAEAAKDAGDKARAAAVRTRAQWAELRTKWAPALDERTLASADLLETAKMWGAAAPYADQHHEAKIAVENAEVRLRELRPQTMSVYDRLRDEQAMSRADAMEQVAPMFAHADARAHHASNIEGELVADNPLPVTTELEAGDRRPTFDSAEAAIGESEREAATIDISLRDDESTPNVDERAVGEDDAARHHAHADGAEARARSPQHTNEAAWLTDKSKPSNGWSQRRSAKTNRRSSNVAARRRRTATSTATKSRGR